MNGFDLGGQCLKVGRCVTPPDALNYLSVGTASSALPAAAAIGLLLKDVLIFVNLHFLAAAEATAKIQAQEVLGGGKRSPGASPADQNGASPRSSSPTPPPTGIPIQIIELKCHFYFRPISTVLYWSIYSRTITTSRFWWVCWHSSRASNHSVFACRTAIGSSSHRTIRQFCWRITRCNC